MVFTQWKAFLFRFYLAQCSVLFFLFCTVIFMSCQLNLLDCHPGHCFSFDYTFPHALWSQTATVFVFNQPHIDVPYIKHVVTHNSHFLSLRETDVISIVRSHIFLSLTPFNVTRPGGGASSNTNHMTLDAVFTKESQHKIMFKWISYMCLLKAKRFVNCCAWARSPTRHESGGFTSSETTADVLFVSPRHDKPNSSYHNRIKRLVSVCPFRNVYMFCSFAEIIW